MAGDERSREDLLREVAELRAALSERERGERALRSQLEDYETLADAMQDFLFVIDRDDRIEYVNRAAAELLGRPAGELVGKARTELFPPGTAERQGRSLRQVFEGGAAVTREDPTEFPKGAMWLHTHLVPLTDAQGNVESVAGFSRDITLLRRAQEELQRSEANYRAIFNATNDAIFVHDIATGAIVDVNRRMTEMYGYTADEVRGWGAGCFGTDETLYTQAEAKRRFRLAVAGQPQFFEWRSRHRSGRPFWVEIDLKRVNLAGRDRLLAVVRDIDARKQSETSLRISEERFRALSAGVSEGIAITRNGKNEWVNPALCRIFGYSQEELIGKGPEAVVAPEEVPRLTQQMRDRLAGKDVPSRYETIGVRRDGTRIHLDVAVSMLPYEGADRIQVIIRDITEQKQAEEALRASEARYRAIVENQTELICRSLPDTTLTYINDVYCRTFGKRREDLIGRSFLDLIPEAERESVKAPFEATVAGAPVQAHEHRVVTATGEVRWQRWTNRAIFNEAGEVVEYQAVGRDVTERRRAEEALRLSELQYRSTLDALADPVHVVDRNCRIVLMNTSFRNWCRELDLPTDAIGHTLFEVFPFLPDGIAREYRRVFETGQTLITEETQAVSGREFTTETRKIPVFEDDRVVRVVTVIHDLTRRRAMERELRKAEKLESISILAGSLAHDFNNLLTGITNSVAFARGRVDSGSAVAGSLADADRAASRAKGMIQRLLTFSDSEALILRPVLLAPRVREAAELMLAGSSTVCDIEVPDDLPPVLADPDRIDQLFQNLLLNARQATADAGTIRIHAEPVEVGADTELAIAPGPYMRVAVEDNGSGIPKDVLPKVFDLYFTTRRKGTGLGLASSYSIVDRHGGNIHVHSREGEGTKVHVYLPLAGDPGPLPRASGDMDEASARILLMDDDAIVCRGARRLLEECGFEVSCAVDGAEAVALYKQAREEGRPFGAAVLDLTVDEGVGGLECLRRLQAIDPEVKAIVCSGHSSDHAMANYRECGFRGAVRKPYSLEQLEAALRDVLSG